MMYADVIVAVSNRQVDKAFQYGVTGNLECLIKIGMRVLVPFGNGNKNVEGYVIGISDKTDYNPAKIKNIIQPLDGFPMFSAEMLELAVWMKEKYYAPLSVCLKCIMPAGVALKSDYIACASGASNPQGITKKQKQVLTYIEQNGGRISELELKEFFGTSVHGVLTQLSHKGCLELKQVSEAKDYSIRMKWVFLNDDVDENEIDQILSKNSPQCRVLSFILENNGGSVSEIKEYLKVSDSPINTLVKNNILRVEALEVRRTLFKPEDYERTAPFVPTSGQKAAIAFINDRIDKKSTKPILLHGVTGSGKTEVYMQIIDRVLAENKQAIMLVPEISLTPQITGRFIGRYGHKVSVTHSRLSLGERYDQWRKAKDGSVSIIIGPRSAVFAPFENVGVIIIDEEHENAYKSDLTPKYSAKEIAIKRAELCGCAVVFGSATPLVTTFYEAQTGKIDLVQINDRVNKSMPTVHIVDMRQELAEANMSVFGRELKIALEQALANKQQAILFLNRRGHSTFVSCRKCGHVMSCDSCNVNYTYHIYNHKLLCHYCGQHVQNPSNCPICGSKYIKYFGLGTQRLEEQVSKEFPAARVLRMDIDTTSRKNSHATIINEFHNGNADILIGTQMIAKGLDFPNVSLVGIIAADMSLNQGDFRSAETTYQLLTQVAGRAGRANIKGNVYIQTYNPEHYSIVYSQSNDYEQFYQHEIIIRRDMCYPPYSSIFNILFTCESERKLILVLNKLLQIMNHYNRKGLFYMLGPSPAFISKIKNMYRWKLLVKSTDEEKLRLFVIYCIEKLRNCEDMSGINMSLTLNPVTMD